MKCIKSTCQDLRELFDNISVRYIAENLASFDAGNEWANVKAFMAEHDYDIVGIRKNGVVVGYIDKTDFDDVTCNRHRDFNESDIIPDSTSLIEVFKLLRDRPNFPILFIKYLDQVSAIVTKGDLQKAPVRMWLFSLVTMLEMNMLRTIRIYHPEDSWKVFLSELRLEKASACHQLRISKNESIDLADCLQFCDKSTILVKSEKIRNVLHFESIQSAKKILKDSENLRNLVAHAQDILCDNWPSIVDTAEQIENLLEELECVSAKY